VDSLYASVWSLKLTNLVVKRRHGFYGNPSIAPFIDGFNVWDIPEKEWTPAVQAAVLHAYRIGRRVEKDIIRASINKESCSLNEKWPEPVDAEK
jgi:hypothetical protein